MRRFACLVVLAVAVAPVAASADVFKLYGEVGGGGAFGKGLSGTYKDEAFFGNANGGVASLLIGGRFLIFDGNIRHNQFLNGGETETWTQFTLGLAFGMDSGSEEDKKQHTGGYFEMGAALGFGLGTGAQVMPPLDNSEVTDKGFMLEGRFGFGKHLSSVFDIGVTAPVSWGYFFKSGGGANNTDNQYQGFQLQALLVLRANLRLL
ncbi:MAG TPA: hypothetical protein VIV40_34625 [Kofleriaceae bacterium]